MNQYFIPHGICLRWSLPLVATVILGDLLVFAAYCAIPIELLRALHRGRVTLSAGAQRILADFALFILFCGGGHLISIALLWFAWYWAAALWTLFGTALFSWRCYRRIWQKSDLYIALLSVPVDFEAMRLEITELKERLAKVIP